MNEETQKSEDLKPPFLPVEPIMATRAKYNLPRLVYLVSILCLCVIVYRANQHRYENIQTGMTRAEVENILGGKGEATHIIYDDEAVGYELYSQVNGGEDIVMEHKSKSANSGDSFYWMNSYAHSVIIVVFQNDRVVKKLALAK